MKRYREFETNNAIYTLYYGDHTKPTYINDIEKFDAIILETGVDKYEEVDIYSLLFNIQYYKLFEENSRIRNPRPIFYVDVPNNDSIRDIIYKYPYLLLISELQFALITLYSSIYLFLQEIPAWAILLVPSLSTILSFFTTDKAGKFLGYLSLSRALDRSSYRSAISAKKIEEFVAPEIKKRIGRKPNILIVYGAGHNDMEPYLKHKKLRDIVIKIQKYMPWWKVNDISYENKVGELRNKNSIEPTKDAEKLIIDRKPDKNDWELILYEI